MADEDTGVQVTPQAEQPAQAAEPQSQPAHDETWTDGRPFDPEQAKALIEKLRGEVKALKPQAKKAETYEQQMKAQKDAELTEVERIKKQLDETVAELQGVKRRETAAKVAAKYGLPAPLAERLKGDTEEEMEADAAQLAKALPKAAAMNPTNPGTSAPSETDAQKRARIYGGGGEALYNPDIARKMGGGVPNQ
jgi:hypothetical protein